MVKSLVIGQSATKLSERKKAHRLSWEGVEHMLEKRDI